MKSNWDSSYYICLTLLLYVFTDEQKWLFFHTFKMTVVQLYCRQMQVVQPSVPVNPEVPRTICLYTFALFPTRSNNMISEELLYALACSSLLLHLHLKPPWKTIILSPLIMILSSLTFKESLLCELPASKILIPVQCSHGRGVKVSRTKSGSWWLSFVLTVCFVVFSNVHTGLGQLFCPPQVYSKCECDWLWWASVVFRV